LSRKRVFLYVQHLLGIGHLKRAVTLARALVDEGIEVTLASGGVEVPGLAPEGAHFVQLPPAAAPDLQFRTLVDAHGKTVDEAWRSRRREALLTAWRTARPHALVLELFPFGRRQMRFELLRCSTQRTQLRLVRSSSRRCATCSASGTRPGRTKCSICSNAISTTCWCTATPVFFASTGRSGTRRCWDSGFNTPVSSSNVRQGRVLEMARGPVK